MNRTLLITRRKGKILSLLYQNTRLIGANAYEAAGDGLASIYLGKVKNVVPSLEACFVEYQPDKIGFLPMKQVKNPILTNRAYDGRLIAQDEVVVQLEKEGIKTKGPSLTCNLSFSGKYCAVTTGDLKIGFSSKLSRLHKEKLRKELSAKGTEAKLRQEGVGIVIRTNAGELETISSLWEELEQLLEEKNRLFSQAHHRTCFSRLYQPLSPYLAGIRDLYEHSYDKILTDEEGLFQEITRAFPNIRNKLQFYQDERISLSRLYNVETRLQEALSEKVWLKNGAYLVIQPTEALTVIDVNSGKNQTKGKDEDIVFRINREAAQEIALQLKLRNLSGIIIIDFINQSSCEQDKELVQYLTRLVKKDAVQTDVLGMTTLGLVEVTRKKISKPLREQLKA